MTPATGLKSGQKVLVQASGFSPGESLVVTECAAKGTATGPGDCDLNGMQSVTSDASGRVKVDLTVTKGPFGANNIVCGPAQACLISVTQATPSPTQEADTPITFGLPGHARRDGDQPGHDRDLRRAARRTGTRMRAAPATPRNTPATSSAAASESATGRILPRRRGRGPWSRNGWDGRHAAA